MHADCAAASWTARTNSFVIHNGAKQMEGRTDVKELPTATPLLDNHARSSSMGGNGGATAISKNKLCGPIR